ncbi:MAG: hypothetical protein ISEC1_P0808 [Thiomicrorhabdus sp.]|nr:MAG: hypothetical protein ISEC1_P0808 [Thiomicrorhabdus sp.]
MFKYFFTQFSLWTVFFRVLQKNNQSAICKFRRSVLIVVALTFTTQASFAEENFAVLQLQTERFQQGWKAANDGKFDKAYEIWLELSKETITVPELKRALQNNLAVIHIKKKEFDQAQMMLDSALKADVQVAVTLANLNQIYSYQAQSTYKTVFSGAEVVWPQGEFLFFDLDITTLPTELVLTELPESSDFKLQETQGTLLVKDLLSSWKEAWSSQDVNAYLGFYDKAEFIPRFGGTFDQWAKGRFRSLTKPKYIKIEFKDIQIVQLDKGLIRSRFLQKYQSDRFKDDIYKVVLWQLFDGQWKIVQEVVVKNES